MRQPHSQFEGRVVNDPECVIKISCMSGQTVAPHYCRLETCCSSTNTSQKQNCSRGLEVESLTGEEVTGNLVCLLAT